MPVDVANIQAVYMKILNTYLLQDPLNPRARIYKHFVKHSDKNVAKTSVSQSLSVGAEIGSGDAGLAARQLLAETIVAAGATFTDERGPSKGGKGKASGKGKKGARQAHAWRELPRLFYMISCPSAFSSHTNQNPQT